MRALSLGPIPLAEALPLILARPNALRMMGEDDLLRGDITDMVATAQTDLVDTTSYGGGPSHVVGLTRCTVTWWGILTEGCPPPSPGSYIRLERDMDTGWRVRGRLLVTNMEVHASVHAMTEYRCEAVNDGPFEITRIGEASHDAETCGRGARAIMLGGFSAS